MNAGGSCSAARERAAERRVGRGRHAALALAAACLVGAGGSAGATDGAGRSTVSLSFQAIRTSGAFLASGGSTLPDSSSEGWSALLELDYALGERWSLYLGLPYVAKRFTGFPPHNPARLETPHPEAEFIDDGRTHGGLQDWRLGLSYRTGGARWEAVPFVRAEIPSREYPHFGSAAIGQNLWRVEVGADFAHQLEFSNFYYGAGYSYTFVEETLGVRPNYHRVPLRVGYFVTPRLGLEIFALGKLGQGTDAGDYECLATAPNGDCVRIRADERWYQHDRQLRHDYVNVGVTASYAMGDDWSVSLSTWEMVWGRSINRVDYAANLTLSRRF